MPDLPYRLRDALVTTGFTHDRVVELLGPLAHAALERNETTPGERATRGGSPLETLTRLFLLQRRVTRVEADTALPDLVDAMAADGLLATEGDRVEARLDVRPYATDEADLWVVSDLTPGLDGVVQRVTPDHVLGVSSASTSLAQQTVRRPVTAALDLGTGCGVQALHLAAHAERVVATDVNQRALWLARFNARLNQLEDRVDVRPGSLFEPVAEEQFDLIVTNPPFVISPATGQRLVYRDSGWPGDRVVEQIVRGLPGHLNPDGWGQVLANWIITRGRPWEERLAEWLDADCDALVVQREVLDPAAYVELWLRDAGLAPDYVEAYDRWLSWFEEQRVEGVGFGWVNLHRTGGGRHELLEWPYDVEQPIAPAIGAWGDAVVQDRVLTDDALLAARLRSRADVREESHGAPGATDPETIVLRQQRGFMRAHAATTAEAGLVGASDGDLTVGQIIEALAALLEQPPAQLRTDLLPAVRRLLLEGFLVS